MLFYISSLQYCEGIVAFSRGSLRVRVWPRLPNSPQILVNQSCFEPTYPPDIRTGLTGTWEARGNMFSVNSC